MPPLLPGLKKKIVQPIAGLLQRAKDNSAIGVAKNTVTGIPKAAVDVAKKDALLVKDNAKKAVDIGKKALPGIPRIVEGLKTGNWDPYVKGLKDQAKPLTESPVSRDPSTGKLTINKENAEARINLVGGFTGGDVGRKAAGILKGGTKSVPSEADKLIAEGKLRVVSRNGRDVYQVKKGKNWANTRDESSAVAQVTRGPAPKKPEAPEILAKKQEIADQRTHIQLLKDAAADHPGKQLVKYRSRSSGDLAEVHENYDKAKGRKDTRSKFAREGDLILQNKIGQDATRGGDVDVGQEMLEGYQKLNERVKGGKETLGILRKELKEARKPHLKFDAAGKPLAYTPRQQGILNRSPYTPKAEIPPTVGQIAKKRYLPLKRTEGEIRSFEKAAQAATSPEVPRIPKGLDPDIEKLQTPVKKKVNALDYFRTPDRVLKKVGMGEESKELRRAFDAYQNELPKNLEVITQWSKLVKNKKGASERIFKYLDGQNITLDSQERLIAGEIKDWLADWADRLKLPPSARIRDYITHIFDDQLVKKEFDEDLAKIIADKVPGEVYDPFLEKRVGVAGYKQDAWAALDAYVKRATRKVHMDPALERIEVKANALEKSQFDYVKNYVDRVNMRPTDLDTLIDNFIKSTPIQYRLGQRPTLAVTRGIRKTFYRAMLGLNPGSALRNLSQGANVYAKLGEINTFKGYAGLFSAKARKEIAESGVLNNNFIQDRSINATKKAVENMDKGLFVFFDAAEKINRGAAYLGGKAKAQSLGLKGQEAEEFAKKIVRDTQFNYDAIDTPALLGSDIVKTLTQFTTYPVKQTEFLTEMARNKEWAGLIRYGASGLVFVYTLGQALGMKPEELVPLFSFGRFAEDGAPITQFIGEVGGAALGVPDEFGNKRTIPKRIEDASDKILSSIVPGGTQIRKTFKGLEAVNKGGSIDKSGRLQYQVGGTPVKDTQAIVFGKSSTPEAREYYREKEKPKKKTIIDEAEARKTEYRNTKIRPIYDNVQKLVAEGKEDEARALVDQLSDSDYEEYKTIKTAEKSKRTKELQVELIPTYEKIQGLKAAGRIEEATAIVEAMSDDEYHAYDLLKKKLQ